MIARNIINFFIVKYLLKIVGRLNNGTYLYGELKLSDMKKLIIFSAFIISSLVTIGQTPKKSKKKANPRNYNGCITSMDSALRKASWVTIDSMRARGYIKN